ncbi:unnamed protein product [Parnassius mnemosyne]|uniref:STPR domain-containing protein n=1 Tax=Parnassius mnemosyne TaxID=213953 RepID=A0AAV1KUD9_9NEOP
MRKRYLEESNDEKNKSLEANSKRIRLTRSQECLNQREERLSKMRSYNNDRLSQECEEQCAHRLGLIRERLSNETEDEHLLRLDAAHCIAARANANSEEAHIEYLAATELLPNITYNNRKVDINVRHESAFNGHVDNDNSEEGFPNLLNALIIVFATYEKKPPDNVVPKDVNNCSGLLSEVKLAVKSRVMLKRNDQYLTGSSMVLWVL